MRRPALRAAAAVAALGLGLASGLGALAAGVIGDRLLACSDVAEARRVAA